MTAFGLEDSEREPSKYMRVYNTWFGNLDFSMIPSTFILAMI